MPADSPPPIISATRPEHRLPFSLIRTAGCIAAAILVLVFAIQAYWAVGDAGPDFHPLLPPLAVAAMTTIWTSGAALLLLTRIEILAVPLPGWLLRVGPWVLTAFFAWLAVTHVLALTARPSGDWQIDLQGPLLLLLAGLCIVVASEEPEGADHVVR